MSLPRIFNHKAYPGVPERIESERLVLSRVSSGDPSHVTFFDQALAHGDIQQALGYAGEFRINAAPGSREYEEIVGQSVLGQGEHWAHLCYGEYIVTKKEGGTAVGMVGFEASELDSRPDFGWVLLPEHRGKGYATEAAASVLEMSATRRIDVFSHISAESFASVAVADRLGLVDTGWVRVQDGSSIFVAPHTGFEAAIAEDAAPAGEYS